MDIKDEAKDFLRELEKVVDKFKELQHEIEDLKEENERLKSQ